MLHLLSGINSLLPSDNPLPVSQMHLLLPRHFFPWWTPLSSSITLSLFHSQLKTYLPITDTFPPSTLTPWTLDQTISSEHICFCFSFSHKAGLCRLSSACKYSSSYLIPYAPTSQGRPGHVPNILPGGIPPGKSPQISNCWYLLYGQHTQE